MKKEKNAVKFTEADVERAKKATSNSPEAKALQKMGVNRPELREEATEKLNDPELIIHIHKELDKKHLRDNKEKLTTFICACTAYLQPPELHKSMAVLGDSSVGKDNLILSTLSLFPFEDWIFLTHGTQSTMQDDIQQFKIIGYSEFNTGKESGANIHLIETLKQLTEGGTSSLKKDAQTGFRLGKLSKQEQKTVFYGSTEESKDEELETRFVCLSIKGEPSKTRIVNDNTIDIFAGLKKKASIDSWVPYAISELKVNKVIIPCAVALKPYFDSGDPRSQRDVKRLMSFISAIAWLHQKQRNIVELYAEKYIIGQPIDVLLGILICAEFFNQTYQGVEPRLQEVLDVMNEYMTRHLAKDVPRTYCQQRIKKVLNTVKNRIRILKEMGLVEFTRCEKLIPYYTTCQKPVKNLLKGVKFEELKKLLTDTSFINQPVKFPKNTYSLTDIDTKLLEKVQNQVFAEEIDRLKLTGSEIPKDSDLILFIKEKGKKGYCMQKFAEKYGESTMERLLQEGQVMENPSGFLKELS